MENIETDWDLKSLAAELSGNNRNTESIEADLSDALMKTISHDYSLQSRGKETKFIRNTDQTNLIAHNERMKQSLENTASQSM